MVVCILVLSYIQSEGWFSVFLPACHSGFPEATSKIEKIFLKYSRFVSFGFSACRIGQIYTTNGRLDGLFPEKYRTFAIVIRKIP